MLKKTCNLNSLRLSESTLNSVFQALSDSTRRAILKKLSNGNAVVSELAEPFDMSLPAISKHLGILERAGLIKREKEGRIRRCQLQTGTLKNAADWIAYYQQFWDTRFDALDDYLKCDIDVTVARKGKG